MGNQAVVSTPYMVLTTGNVWHFIQLGWLPRIQISKEFVCDFKGNLESSKQVLSYIIRLLHSQAKSHMKISEIHKDFVPNKVIMLSGPWRISPQFLRIYDRGKKIGH